MIPDPSNAPLLYASISSSIASSTVLRGRKPVASNLSELTLSYERGSCEATTRISAGIRASNTFCDVSDGQVFESGVIHTLDLSPVVETVQIQVGDVLNMNVRPHLIATENRDHPLGEGLHREDVHRHRQRIRGEQPQTVAGRMIWTSMSASR